MILVIFLWEIGVSFFWTRFRHTAITLHYKWASGQNEWRWLTAGRLHMDFFSIEKFGRVILIHFLHCTPRFFPKPGFQNRTHPSGVLTRNQFLKLSIEYYQIQSLWGFELSHHEYWYEKILRCTSEGLYVDFRKKNEHVCLTLE